MSGEQYTITTAPIEEFFGQGREIAQKLDRGDKLEPIRMISFEVEDRPIPSHGRMKFIKPLADTFNLMFQFG